MAGRPGELPPIPNLGHGRFAIVDEGQEFVIPRGGTGQAFILRVKRRQILLELPVVLGPDLAGNVVLAHADIDERLGDVVKANPGVFAARLVQQLLVETLQGQITEATTAHAQKSKGKTL